MIIGHEKIMDFFANAIKSGSLSHAYCFIGAAQVGKRTAAYKLASQIIGVEQEKLQHYPDFFYLRRESDEKTGKLKKNISITQTRELRARLSNHPWLGGYQVAIVDEAEFLNSESANALLKILEEPGAKRIFFILAENEQMILSTIRSRCQQFYFNLVDESKIASGLIANGVEVEKAERLAKFSWGRPGRALEMAADAELEAQYVAELNRWQKIIDAPFHLKLKELENLFGEKEDTVRRQSRLQKILDIWIMFWRDLMLARSGQTVGNVWVEELLEKIKMDSSGMAKIILSMEEAKALLAQNVNAQLLFEQLLLKF